MNVSWPLRIYYDASCPLCREEMQAIVASDREGRIELHDASGPDGVDAQARAAGLDRSALMRLIHARDAEGRWHVGVDVFVIAYGAVGLTGMSRFWAHPRLRPLWDRLYPWIARARQPLSWLRLNRIYGAWVRRAARRAQQRAQACADGHCPLPAGKGH
ncbi:MAG TPA: DUF393 domain-containing protein [Arenimonas sp.]|nr:DUF393 domain-containing protein [Arenimonas sp.]